MAICGTASGILAYVGIINPVDSAIFLDRDGVLIENRSDYVRRWSQVSILPNTLAALSRFKEANYKIVIVTNQSAVGRGLMSIDVAQDINERLAKIIGENNGRVDAIYMCPHRPEDQCDCRKPRPGLFLQAARDLSLDLSSSWIIGDAWSDLLAGQAAGLKRLILVRTGRGESEILLPQPEKIIPFQIFDNLFDALRAIERS